MKNIKFFLIIVIMFLLIGGISIPIVNNYCAYKVEKMLLKIELPKQTELIESTSKAGKLTGNGNGIQYFGAILIKSELTIEELESYYSKYRRNEWEYLVVHQVAKKITVTDHGELQFLQEINSKMCYMVYSWGSGNDIFSAIDLRGH